MLTVKQIKEIREHLNKAQNPIFFFDNDGDGLCSFLLLQRFIGRGKGVPIRTFPELSSDYVKRINELNADYIFILDKPIVSQEFFEEIRQINLPIVYIDHHKIDFSLIPKFVNYYNPLLNKKKTNEPVTYLCYGISQKKEDAWIALIGSICDNYVPKFYSQIQKDYPDLTVQSKKSPEIYYNSQLGKIAQMFNFALKDSITNVVTMIKFLMKVKSPNDVLNESKDNFLMHKRFEEINKKYHKFLEKACDFDKKEKMIFFEYGGETSISADIANGLKYRFPNKVIVVAYISGAKANISVRGKKIREIALKAIKDLEDASGGGHEDAVGLRVKIEDLGKLRENFKKLI
ncbi:MAG: DHHA1 domain-containing protein [Nanoarchaeota archaeon]|nr:DHHA1 domain-containing protein [Nanoarchaeota archaeon]